MGDKDAAPQVRLATTTAMLSTAETSGSKRYPHHVDNKPSPQVRLAHVPGAQGDNNLLGQRGVDQLPLSSAPALLVSYAYLQPFMKARHLYQYRDWVLDSGAFSAHAAGKTIELARYIDVVKELLAGEDPPSEVFALDVIGDHVASTKNADLMVEAGLDVIPCFHFGEPWESLLDMAKRFDKIALGGVARMKQGKRIEWVGQCFARVWPKKIHGFGMSTRELVLGFPFHSVDATSWELGPCGFGNWKSFGKMSVRGSAQNLRAEVEWYLKLEREAQQKWAKEMKQLEAQSPVSVRLSVDAAAVGGKRIGAALEPRAPSPEPVVRLAHNNGIRISALSKGEKK